ncbi:SMAD/FHA domain-containing protein [Polychytrium aggregatum]|uniref:SMAD/FHA domain-containing protein n=1 Tax=Polychytrium aggregatum TaxID=110093 RepID=UPI0022FDC507|nr:SMAD/FHA domain-containing protein [Polychytrium aggregatum]KAI9201928.1 SMAD/FHA domain-containing protein [Polychytrium aggregatum]
MNTTDNTGHEPTHSTQLSADTSMATIVGNNHPSLDPQQLEELQGIAPPPIIILECIDGSFETKVLDLRNKIKIGRKVSPQASSDPSNGIFNSKVLSRNHAEIEYRAGKVLIRDVRSSNGTFVNGNRLSAEGVMSPDRELRTGDRLEFGIDIMEDDNVTVLHKKVTCLVHIHNANEDLYTSSSTGSTGFFQTLPANYDADPSLRQLQVRDTSAES